MGDLAVSDSQQQGTGQSPLDLLLDAHGQAQATSSKVGEASRLANVARRSLDELVTLGDQVQPDDVIREAAKMIGEGFDSVQLASLLADMPATGGAALAAWVDQHDQALAQQEQQVEASRRLATHREGVAALHVIVGHAVHGVAGGATAGKPAAVGALPENALAPSTGVGTAATRPTLTPATPTLGNA